MKIPDRVQGWHLLALGLPLLFLAGWGGHAAGKSSAARRLAHEGDPAVTARKATMEETQKRGARTPSTADLKRSSAQLLRIWRDSPDPNLDFELMGEAARMLDGRDAGELAALYQEFRGASLENRMIRREILAAWVAKDGAAALSAMGGNLYDRFTSIDVFRNWMLLEPDAAMKWLSEGDAPPSLKDYAKTLRLNSLRTLVEVNAGEAFAQIPRMERAEAVQNLRNWINSSNLPEAMRQRAMELAKGMATPQEMTQIHSYQAVQMSVGDPAGAAALVETLELPANERLQLDARIQMANPGVPDGKAIEGWLSGHPDQVEVPTAVSAKLSSWLFKNRDEGTRWLDGMPPGPGRDLIYANAVRDFIGFDGPAQAAAYAEKIESPAARTSALRTLDRLWPDLDSSAAAAWREGLSAEDRSLLGD